jgi:dUTPase
MEFTFGDSGTAVSKNTTYGGMDINALSNITLPANTTTIVNCDFEVKKKPTDHCVKICSIQSISEQGCLVSSHLIDLNSTVKLVMTNTTSSAINLTTGQALARLVVVQWCN